MTVPPSRSRGRPRLEDTAGIDSHLLGVALAEFLAHGYGGASMSRIVRAAGISKTTLYSRFASKEALFRAIVQQQIEKLAAETALRSDAGALDLVAGLTAYADRSLAISLEGDLLQVNRLIYSESNRFPELGAAAAERTMIGVEQIADFIRQRAEADGIPCSDPKRIAEAFIFMLRGWYVDIMLANRPVSAEARRQWAAQAVHALIASRDQW